MTTACEIRAANRGDAERIVWFIAQLAAYEKLSSEAVATPKNIRK